jgi:hypothetical protein
MTITWQQAVAATKLHKCCFGGNRRRQHEHGDTDDEDDIAIEYPGTHPQRDPNRCCKDRGGEMAHRQAEGPEAKSTGSHFGTLQRV